MKGIPAILAVLVIGMLVFGCTTSSNYSANYSANGSANVSASGGAQNTAGQPASGTAGPSGTASGGNNPESGGTNTAGGGTPAPAEPDVPLNQDLSGKNYSSLIQSGTASRCTVSFTDNSDSMVTLDLYFDGKGSMRMEQQDTGYSDCPYALMIFKGNSSGDGMLYLTCPDHEEEALGTEFGTHEICKWHSMDISSEYGGIGSATLGLSDGYSTWALDYLTSPEYSCQQWTLDGSKFDTSGTVCD